MDVQTYLIEHLGLVAGIFDELSIDKAIDRAIPKLKHHKIPHSVAIKAMILNGLGFTGQRLYLFPTFFRNIPVEKLLGSGISPDDLNDDVIGRTLDAIHEYGATELFNEITLRVMSRASLGSQLIHVDTTNFSVYGKYEKDASDGTDSIKITYGHAKDGRMDLKRFVLSMVANQSGIPLFVKAYSGNESDKKSIIKTIQMAQASLNLDDDCYWIADSALYSEENIKILGTGTLWITHVPATVKEAKALLNAKLEMSPGKDLRYTFHTTTWNYGNIPQRVVVVWSEEMQTRKEKTFDKCIQKGTKQAEKELKELMRRTFACEPDARNEAKLWIRGHPYHRFKDLRIISVSEKVEKRKGRPRKDEPLSIRYVIEAAIELDPNSVTSARKMLGRFVLASNDLKLDPETMLNYYKGQQTVERGFRFLKDKSFHVSEVYLKKEERIESLAMIMVLSLLVYAFGEWKLREKLRLTGQNIPNQLNKPTQRPTLRWVFFLFMGVTQVIITEDGQIRNALNNLNEVQSKILRLLGPRCEKYYGLDL